MATKTMQKPKWWRREYDSAWERVKAAFKRDWQQTKYDFGADEPDLDQNVDDTVGQLIGTQAIPPANEPDFDDQEDAFRYGYGARHYYGNDFPDWSEELEDRLRSDWGKDWRGSRGAIRRGWDYAGDSLNE